MATLEQWRKQLQNTLGIFQNFRFIIRAAVLNIGKIDDKTNPPRGGLF